MGAQASRARNPSLRSAFKFSALAATRHTVAHVRAQLAVSGSAVRVRSARPLAQGIDDGQVDAVGVLQMLAQFRLLLTAQVALADGDVELGRSQSALALDDVLAVVGVLLVYLMPSINSLSALVAS